MPDNRRVSFVVTSRNDNHGGDMLRRLKVFTQGLLEQANRHSLSGELIIVEWNPPPGPRLHEVLDLSVKSDIFAIRFIEVPLEAHRRIRNSDVIPLFQMIAKNVGIRRATGNMIVATNPDLLFSDALMSFLASDDVHTDSMYRIDRHDVPANLDYDGPVSKQLAWCAANVLRIHTRRGSFTSHPRFFSKLHAAIALLSYGRWPRRGLALKIRRLSFQAAMDRWVRLSSRLRRAATSQILKFRLAGALYAPRQLLRRLLWGILRLTDPLPKVHTNGCGDFTVLPKASWMTLRGYPELPLWSMHIDSLLCYMAVAAGIRERILRAPARLFHIEHENSWVVMTPAQRLKTFAAKPWMDIGLLQEIWEVMYKSQQPVLFNDENWGLADWTLDEVCIISGEKHPVQRNKDLKAG